MNPDQPSRDQIETRLTALLLGELPAEEAALLRYTMAQDPALQLLHDELQATLALVREAAKHPVEAAVEKAGPVKLQLPAERRRLLLAHFKTPRTPTPPQPLFWLRRIEMPRLAPILAVLALMALLAALLLPALSKAKMKSRSLASLGARDSGSDLQIAQTISVEKKGRLVTAAGPTAPTSGAMANYKPASAPVELTLAPEPQLAPPPASLPPVQIVLPPTESDQLAIGRESAPAAVALNAPANAGDSLQALPLSAAPATPPPSGAATTKQLSFNYYDGYKSADKPMQTATNQEQRTVPGQALDPIVNFGLLPARAISGGGGGFGGAESTPSAGQSQDAGVSTLSQKLSDASANGAFVANADQSASWAFPSSSVGGVAGLSGVAGNRSYREEAKVAEQPKVPTLGTVPAVGALFQSSPDTTKQVGTPIAAAPRAAPAPAAAFDTGALATKDSRVRSMREDTYARNERVLKSDAAQLPMDALNKPTERTPQTMAQPKTQIDQEYDLAKRDLDQKQKLHQMLYSKLEIEKLDAGLPQTSMVQVTDVARPGQSRNLWQRLTGQVESSARVKVENDVTDIAGMSGTPAMASFDPYFIQTTFEAIQSDAVLAKVVDDLNLQSTWAGKNAWEKLTKSEAVAQLKQRLDLRPVQNTKLIEIGAKSNDPTEAAEIANAVARAYADYRAEFRRQLTTNGLAVLEDHFGQQAKEIQLAQAKVDQLGKKLTPVQTQPQSAPSQDLSDLPLRKPAPNAPVPQPEILTKDNNFSTFSLNVSDVSFKFAEASLHNGKLPDPASIRSEEFINAFDYRDPAPGAGQAMAFAAELARDPFAHNRDLLRFAVKTAAAGRPAGGALNLVLLLDKSGSMERADRVAIIHEALRVLATQLQPQDTVSVVTFARTARLWADGLAGDKAGETLDRVGGITPEGGTNLEEAMRLAYETAHRHYLPAGMNRVVLLTDGAANLGAVQPEALKQTVEAQRKQGIALDCFGIGWEDYNDDLLEQLSSNGDGRYAFLNSPEEASKDFAAKLAGALQIAAADVKVQVEFNPGRVRSYRQIGYARHQLTKEQFRDNTVAAGEIAAQEAGNALYTIETDPNGSGSIATVHVRYRIPGATDYREHSWEVAYSGTAPALDQASPAMRLAATASAFSEWLATSPYAQQVTPDELLKIMNGVPAVYGADDRPKQLETMLREARSLQGK